MTLSLPSFHYRVYLDDTDAGGIVYHANYLKISERARTDQLRQAGFDHSQSLMETGGSFVVRTCHLTCFKPAKLSDDLIVNTIVKKVYGPSVTLEQTITHHNVVLAELLVILVWIDATQQPRRIPPDLKDLLLRYASNIKHE